MDALEQVELALRRARSREAADRVQDISALHVLDLLVDEIHRINLDKRRDESCVKRSTDDA